MHPNETIRHFYSCFAAGDHRGMSACYHPEATFSDPVFPLLRGKEIHAMWHMLSEAGVRSGMTITHEKIVAESTRATCTWRASYSFGPVKRPINNVIHASMDFTDGQIIRHVDSFDFWKWSRMALGPTGLLLGWSPYLKSKVQKTLRHRLDTLIAQTTAYQPAIK
jgi:ketosteroid isomerase-like protein